MIVPTSGSNRLAVRKMHQTPRYRGYQRCCRPFPERRSARHQRSRATTAVILAGKPTRSNVRTQRDVYVKVKTVARRARSSSGSEHGRRLAGDGEPVRLVAPRARTRETALVAAPARSSSLARLSANTHTHVK